MNFYASTRIFGFATVLSLAGCSSVVPPTSTDGLSGGRPGYVIGYLHPSELPNPSEFLAPPPKSGSAALSADEEAYKITRRLRDSARWQLAKQDADLGYPGVTRIFSCALGISVSAETTPHLNMLIRRVRADASRANDHVKSLYQRRRPYIAFGDTSCTPEEKHKDDSYPSGHTSIGWALALVLAEVSPERANGIFARGLAFGDSRMICGVHWKSDIDGGRIVGASTVSLLHSNQTFLAQLALARKEVEAARAAGGRPSVDCDREAHALSMSW